MARALQNLLVFLLSVTWCAEAYTQVEPIRIDRPREGDTVASDLDVAGVAQAGATVEVWIDRVFVVDTVAEPDGWYVAKLRRPPNATAKSRIFVHELDAQGQRTSSAVVRVTWLDQPLPEQAAEPPVVAAEEPVVEPEVAAPEIEAAPEPPVPAATTETVAPAPVPPVQRDRGGRIAVEALLGIPGGLVGGGLGYLLGSAIGVHGSGERRAATLFLASVGGAMGAAGTVYGIGRAMDGNGSFVWTAVGGFGGALLLATVNLASGRRAGAWYVPFGIVAIAMPILGFELSSDRSRVPVSQLTPTMGVSADGQPTLGVWMRW